MNNRYQIDAFLGREAIADVYRAFDTRRSYPVVLKMLPADLAEDTEFVERFRQEVGALATLAHDHIVRHYSFEQDQSQAFWVMDYVDGATLRFLLAQTDGPLPLGQVAHILPQAGQALHFAHEEGVIHGDVQPGNVLIRHDGKALVANFGIAQAVDMAARRPAPSASLAYMSPEQCRNEPPDRRSDVYALGVTLFEMLTGRRPFIGQTENAGSNPREKVQW